MWSWAHSEHTLTPGVPNPARPTDSARERARLGLTSGAPRAEWFEQSERMSRSPGEGLRSLHATSRKGMLWFLSQAGWGPSTVILFESKTTPNGRETHQRMQGAMRR